ncbi:MAG: hypothetical protein OEW48_20860, partial [Phycisphaerae bacterium]|nr:hypothetical protein [Phycisphaerae bacterium]
VRPTQGARCIDAGDNECAEAVGLTSDLDGKPRFIDDCKTPDWGPGEPPIIDMGAYEFLPGDFDVDGDVDWLDLGFFTDRWLYTGCTKTNGFCDGADLNCGGTVNFKDFAKLAQYWLEGVE